MSNFKLPDELLGGAVKVIRPTDLRNRVGMYMMEERGVKIGRNVDPGDVQDMIVEFTQREIEKLATPARTARKWTDALGDYRNDLARDLTWQEGAAFKAGFLAVAPGVSQADKNMSAAVHELSSLGIRLAILAELPIKPVALIEKLSNRFKESEIKDELAKMLDVSNPAIRLTSNRVLVGVPQAEPPKCLGYPDCDGMLPGEEHEKNCPLAGTFGPPRAAQPADDNAKSERQEP
jgi:hypothetical protein